MTLEEIERALEQRRMINKNNMLKYERCPRCGSYRVRRRGTRWSQYSGTLRQLWQCKDCGRIFTGEVLKRL